VKNFFGVKEVNAARQRLERLLKEEDRAVRAQVARAQAPTLVDSERTPSGFNLPSIDPFPQDDKAPADAVGKAFGPFLPAIRALFQSSETFDQYSFRKYMHDFGRAYQNQSMELIAICRLFSQVAHQVLTQDAELTK